LNGETGITPGPGEEFHVPWTAGDTWLGLGLFVFLTLGVIAAVVFWSDASFIQNSGVIILELLYLLPVIVILVGRRAPWRTLGFRPFARQSLEIGCGLFVAAYLLIIVHNIILSMAGVVTQGEQVFQLFNLLENPLAFILAGVLVAPLSEEIFFRGFLFSGFRQRFGWKKAALLSSVFFSLAHMELVTLIPTFILGYLLAYLFHRSNSLWPGVILHFLVNSFGFCMVYAVSQIST
jgi:membrane protease YdiL (CAAX protease family)